MSEKYDDDYKLWYTTKVVIGGVLFIGGFTGLSYAFGDSDWIGWLFPLAWCVLMIFALRAVYLNLFK